MKQQIANLRQNDLVRHNLVFLIGTLAIAVFNYMYYPVISRLVNVREFGEIQAVISLFMQLGIVLTAYGYVITNITNNTKSSTQSNLVILHLERICYAVTLLLFVALIGLSFVFKGSFKIDSIMPVILVGALVIVNVPSTSRTYILQGLRRLKEVSIAGIIFAIGKLVLTVGFIYLLTDNVVSAVLGYIIAQIVNLWYVAWRTKNVYPPVRAILKNTGEETLWRSRTLRALVKKELIYGSVIILALSGLTLMYSSDTIVARLFFDPYTLGLYSGISSIARIIFFVTASIAGVLIASVAIDSEHSEQKRIFWRSLLMLLGIGGAVAIAFSLFPKLFIDILVGSSYAIKSQWLPLVSAVMLLCAVNNLAVSYLIALRQYTVLWSVAAGVMVLVGMLIIQRQSVEHLISAYFVGNAITAIIAITQVVARKATNQ